MDHQPPPDPLFTTPPDDDGDGKLEYRTESELRSEFINTLDTTLAQGAKDYGNGSFFTPPMETPAEILAEIMDVAGWAYVMWVKMRRRLNQIELAAQPHLGECMAGPDCAAHPAAPEAAGNFSHMPEHWRDAVLHAAWLVSENKLNVSALDPFFALDNGETPG